MALLRFQETKHIRILEVPENMEITEVPLLSVAGLFPRGSLKITTERREPRQADEGCRVAAIALDCVNQSHD